MINFLGRRDCCSWRGRASVSSRPLVSISWWQGCCRACRHPLHLQLRPLLCSTGPSVLPFPSNCGAERGKPLQRGEHCCSDIACLHPATKAVHGGLRKPKPLWWRCWLCSSLLALLLTVRAALISRALPRGAEGMQGAREQGRVALPAELERLLSVQRSTQPCIFIPSAVILIFSGFERASRGLPLWKKDLIIFFLFVFQKWFRNKGFS